MFKLSIVVQPENMFILKVKNQYFLRCPLNVHLIECPKISSSAFKRQNDQLREDLRDIQRQSDAQRESLLNKMDSDQQMSEKMKNKNIILNNTLDENRVR